MSQTTTLILLPQTSYLNPGNGAPYTVTGETTPAAAYYLGNKDLQTVNHSGQQFTGNLVVEASLATTPTSNDWFQVYFFQANANAPSNTQPQINSNAAVYTNIEGNFVYLRAKIVDFNGGVLNYAKLSY